MRARFCWLIRDVCIVSVKISHGGANCADYLTGNLHKRIEDVKASDVDDVILQFRNVGG